MTCLFIHLSPNNMAWCKSVKEFLNSQGYKLETKVLQFVDHFNEITETSLQDSLCQRFRNALQWYNAPQDAVNKHVDNVLTHVWQISIGLWDGLPEESMVLSNFPASQTSPTLIPAGQTSTWLDCNPHMASVEEVDDHEFLPHPRSPLLIPTTPSHQSLTSPTPSRLKRQHSDVEGDDDPSNAPSNPFLTFCLWGKFHVIMYVSTTAYDTLKVWTQLFVLMPASHSNKINVNISCTASKWSRVYVDWLMKVITLCKSLIAWWKICIRFHVE